MRRRKTACSLTAAGMHGIFFFEAAAGRLFGTPPFFSANRLMLTAAAHTVNLFLFRCNIYDSLL
jgi:hypothetical protein